MYKTDPWIVKYFLEENETLQGNLNNVTIRVSLIEKYINFENEKSHWRYVEHNVNAFKHEFTALLINNLLIILGELNFISST